MRTESPIPPWNGRQADGTDAVHFTAARRGPSPRIDALDGLRGVSILIVLLGHGASTRNAPALLDPLRELGIVGVDLFFGISGFIITALLLQEQQRQGRIDLPRFWLRRVLRIVPPLGVACLGIAAASAAGILRWSWLSFAGAWTFTKDLPLIGGDWFFGHCWSLSVEEQFYLVWPLLLVLCRNRRRLLVPLCLVMAASPFLAMLCTALLQWLQNLVPSIPYLAAGCVLALLRAQPDLQPLRQIPARSARRWLLGVLVPAAIVAAWWHRGALGWPQVSIPLEGLLLPVAVFAVLAETVAPDGLLAPVLRLQALRALGLVSYSVYLWQQLFLGPPRVYETGWYWSAWPQNVLAGVLFGALSFHLVERPLNRLKARWVSRPAAHTHPQSATPWRHAMKISEVMTLSPYVIDADASVLLAAKSMASIDVGMLPVAREDRVIGVITDRDIVAQVVAGERLPEATPVADIVSQQTLCCNQNDDVELAAQKMEAQRVGRLVVLDDERRLVGVVCLDDLRPRRALA